VQSYFPEVLSYGVQAQQDYQPTAGLSWTGFLNDAQPIFPGDFSQITLQGQVSDECALFHIPTKTVFLADLLMYSLVSNSTVGGNFVPGAWNNQTSFFMRLYYWTYGAYDSLAVPNYQNTWGLITNATAFSESVRKIETNDDIQQIFLANGGIVVQSAKSSLEDAFAPYVV